jgi:hypothetical protein
MEVLSFESMHKVTTALWQQPRLKKSSEIEKKLDSRIIGGLADCNKA